MPEIRHIEPTNGSDGPAVPREASLFRLTDAQDAAERSEGGLTKTSDRLAPLGWLFVEHPPEYVRAVGCDMWALKQAINWTGIRGTRFQNANERASSELPASNVVREFEQVSICRGTTRARFLAKVPRAKRIRMGFHSLSDLIPWRGVLHQQEQIPVPITKLPVSNLTTLTIDHAFTAEELGFTFQAR